MFQQGIRALPGSDSHSTLTGFTFHSSNTWGQQGVSQLHDGQTEPGRGLWGQALVLLNLLFLPVLGAS